MMNRKIRRQDRAISYEEGLKILEEGEYGVLATADAGALPYATPLSYVLHGGKLCFHCALVGHKIDNIRQNPRACFAVVGKTQAVYNGGFSTFYESCLVFGEVREIDDSEEKKQILLALAQKYLPEHQDKAEASIRAAFAKTAVYALHIKSLSAKAKR